MLRVGAGGCETGEQGQVRRAKRLQGTAVVRAHDLARERTDRGSPSCCRSGPSCARCSPPTTRCARTRPATTGRLQVGYFIIAIRAVGLAAGPMIGFDAAAVDADFFAGTTWRSHLVVNIGNPGPDAWFARLPRLDYDDVIRRA